MGSGHALGVRVGGPRGVARRATDDRLVARHESYDWGGGLRGFFVAAIHGRNLHYPTVANRDGRHHDFLFRDLAAPSRNPDVAAADPFAGVERDPRNDAPLPRPSCGLAEVPTSAVPIQLVYRTCDFAVPCNASQGACFRAEPGYDTSAWLARASGRLAITALRIGGFDRGADGFNRDGAACHDFAGVGPPPRTAMCTTTTRDLDCLCYFNHLHWPDGVRDMGGATAGPDREADMLAFLAAHPLP